jgi:hypothetical protein
MNELGGRAHANVGLAAATAECSGQVSAFTFLNQYLCSGNV